MTSRMCPRKIAVCVVAGRVVAAVPTVRVEECVFQADIESELEWSQCQSCGATNVCRNADKDATDAGCEER